MKEEKGDLVADPYSILARWRNHYSQLLSAHWLNNVRQTEIHTAEALVPGSCAFEVEMASVELKRQKSPGIDQIPAELVKAGGGTICPEVHKLIKSVWNKEGFSELWKELIIVPINKKGDKRDCSTFRGIELLSNMYKILSNILLSRLTPYVDEITGDHQCEFCCNRSTTVHIFCIHQIFEKKWEYNEAVHQLFVDFKIAYVSVKEEGLV